MTLSNGTRTHLIYQFIILTLMLLCMGYYELSTERKYIMFLVFIPMFCYQLVILSCCTELLPVPKWMSSCENTGRKTYSSTGTLTDNSSDINPFQRANFSQSARMASKSHSDELKSFPCCEQRSGCTDFEKTVSLRNTYPKETLKSMSYVNLSDMNSHESLGGENLNAQLPNLSSSADCTESKIISRRNLLPEKRKERSLKAQSWRPENIYQDFSLKTSKLLPDNLTNCNGAQRTESFPTSEQEESQMEKSYSFPFRQKRLEEWIELKEKTPSSVNVPYWKTVGYDLAVKYEARRRKRAISGPAGTGDIKGVIREVKKPLQKKDFTESTESTNAPTRANFPWSKKNVYKSSVARVNKIKAGISNFIAKNRKDDAAPNHILNVNGDANAKTFSVREKRTSDSDCSLEEKCSINIPHLPQFLSKERPFVFYPKYIPFEKDRFEADVRNKMIEFSKA